ncbi:MAG: L,D-transpeptidase [Chthoniobacteraceae bacterium]
MNPKKPNESKNGATPARAWRILLLLAIVFLPGCASMQTVVGRLPVPQQSIPSFGGAKRVVIDKTEQKLRAYDGGQLVFETRVSTGMEGRRTPNGSFRARMKEPMHYSSLYDNAPMPYSVQFHGNYFLHGYSVVPDHPASHGCIRLPMNGLGRNPAKLFYDWVRIGTPIRVTGHWQN